MSFIGKICGLIIGYILTSNILGSILGVFAGHFLFDYKIHLIKEDDENDVNDYCDNVNIFNNIIKLCYSLINIKGNILLGEIDSIKYFFKNEFKFDKKEIKLVDEVINNLASGGVKVNYDDTLNGINSYCKYEEKILIVKLLFFLAISDRRINEYETDFIFKTTQKLNIQSSDYIQIKNLFVYDEENFYNILKIDESASNNEIKSAYRRMVSLYHPDKHKGEDLTKKNFRKLLKLTKN